MRLVYHHSDMRRLIPTLALLAAVGLGGCEPEENGLGPPIEPRLPQKDQKDVEIERLQAEADSWHARAEELGARCEQLTEKVEELKFINQQLSKQLQAVGDAPGQRDHYKKLATELGLEILRLTRRIRTLEGLLGIPSSRPATSPASAPAPTTPPSEGEG